MSIREERRDIMSVKKTKANTGKNVAERKQCNSCGRILSVPRNYYKLSEPNPNFPDSRVNVCIKCYNELWEHPTHGFDYFLDFLRIANLPYIESVYQNVEKKSDYLASIRAGTRSSLRHRDSDAFVENKKKAEQDVEKLKELSPEQLRESQEFWGTDFTEEEYLFLMNEYADYNSQYDISGKSMQVLVKSICVTTLKIREAQSKGNSTKDLTRELSDLMHSANLKPSQEKAARENDQNTWEQFIKMIENTKPIPEPDDMFKDPDNIKKYMETYFVNPTAISMGMPMPHPDFHEEMMEELGLNHIHEDVISDDDF